MEINDPILSDLQLSEDGEGQSVYYTILEEGAENYTLEPDQQEILDDNNVFYLSFENEQGQDVTEEQEEDGEEMDMSMFEQIMLSDGTHAYFAKKNVDIEEEQEETNIEEESTMIVEDLAEMKEEVLAVVSEDEDDPEEQELETEYVDENSEEIFDQSKYQQVQLEDGSFAIIEVALYKSLLEQNKDKTQVSREVNKAYDCPHENCSKAYATMHHLRVHMRNHTGNRPYRCEVVGCEKAFSTGYSLKAHSRTHTGEKPYGCQLCFKSFKTSGDLQKHVRIHTGEKPFMCPIDGCGRSFTTSNIRKVHVRSHTGERPYQCSEAGCHKAFASATNFKNHMRIHSGEKPYSCSVEGCGKCFTEYSSLYKHQLVHTNIKPCKCVYCGRTFRQPSTLVAHKRSAHNIIITDNGTEIMLKLENSKQIHLKHQDREQIQTKFVIVSQTC